MKLWLPERIYTLVKDDPTYLSINNRFEKAMFFDEETSLIEYMNRFAYVYDPSSDISKLLNINPIYKEEFNIILSNNVVFLKDKIKTGKDIENRLMAIYYLLAQPIYNEFYSNEFTYYTDEYIKTVNQWKDFDDFSDRIWVKYFEYLSFKNIVDLTKSSENFKYRLDTYIYMNNFFLEKAKEKAKDLDSLEVINQKIYYSLYFFTLYHLVSFPEANYSVENVFEILSYMNTINSKYSGFTLWEMLIYDILYTYCLTWGDLTSAELILQTIREEFLYRIKNNTETIKALSQHNYYLFSNHLELYFNYKVLFSYLNINTKDHYENSKINQEHRTFLYGASHRYVDKGVFASNYNKLARKDKSFSNKETHQLFLNAYSRAEDFINRNKGKFN